MAVISGPHKRLLNTLDKYLEENDRLDMLSWLLTEREFAADRALACQGLVIIHHLSNKFEQLQSNSTLTINNYHSIIQCYTDIFAEYKKTLHVIDEAINCGDVNNLAKITMKEEMSDFISSAVVKISQHVEMIKEKIRKNSKTLLEFCTFVLILVVRYSYNFRIIFASKY